MDSSNPPADVPNPKPETPKKATTPKKSVTPKKIEKQESKTDISIEKSATDIKLNTSADLNANTSINASVSASNIFEAKVDTTKVEPKVVPTINVNAAVNETTTINKNDQSSIDNMMITGMNNTTTDIKTKAQWWSMKDFNNCIEADRKLVVNKTLEFFIHDEVVVTYSDYFANLLGKGVVLNQSIDVEDIKITEIDIPHETKFFEILFWMYSRDSKKLKKASKNFHDFLKMISLGIFLKLKPEFFEILLSKLAFQWKEEFFFDPLWSRKVFTFPVLERIVDEMKTNNFTKTVALLSWLVDMDIKTKRTVESGLEEVLTSIDLFLVRNYITSHQLMKGISFKEVNDLYFLFSPLHSVFDLSALAKEYIFVEDKSFVCLSCKKKFANPYEIKSDAICKGEPYHPRANLKLDKNCVHDGCTKKVKPGELPCCHKPLNAPGCMSAEGRHIIVFGDSA